MKKSFLFSALVASVLSVGTSFAQTATAPESPETTIDVPSALSKGNFLLGTRVGLGSQNNKVSISGSNIGTVTSGDNSSSQMSLTPSLGYFFAENFVVGLGMDYVRNSATAAGKTSVNSTTLFGPFVRYYLPVDESQAFFLGGVSGFGNTRADIAGQTAETRITSFGFGPGYTIIAKNNIAMEAQLKYNFGNSKSTVNVNNVSSSVNTKSNGFDFVVGVSYYFGRSRR